MTLTIQRGTIRYRLHNGIRYALMIPRQTNNQTGEVAA